MRLTPNTLLDAESYINCEGNRTLNLRSLAIPMLENLAVVKDVNEVIDLTDNDLRILSNFPALVRLHTVLAGKNRISSISPDLHKSIPNLQSLSLISNAIASTSAFEPLRHFKKLESLYLKENPVTSTENYRLFLIHLVPSLKVIDFEKVKAKERQQAQELFGTRDDPTPMSKQYLQSTTEAIDIDKEEEQVKQTLKKLTDVDKEKLKQELKNATSLAEIDRIENALKSGYI